MLILFILASLGAINASRQLHLNLLERVLKCSMNFFDSTPIGRLVNRFSKDIDSIDDDMPLVIVEFLECFFESVFIILAVSYASPYFLTVVPGMLILYFLSQVNVIIKSMCLIHFVCYCMFVHVW